MKEREEQTITFPDTNLATWEKLMHFLDSPVAARDMSAEDARDLALFYKHRLLLLFSSIIFVLLLNTTNNSPVI